MSDEKPLPADKTDKPTAMKRTSWTAFCRCSGDSLTCPRLAPAWRTLRANLACAPGPYAAGSGDPMWRWQSATGRLNPWPWPAPRSQPARTARPGRWTNSRPTRRRTMPGSLPAKPSSRTLRSSAMWLSSWSKSESSGPLSPPCPAPNPTGDTDMATIANLRHPGCGPRRRCAAPPRSPAPADHR